MLRGEHLTQTGLREIVAIKASTNRGLSCELQTAFPDVVPMTRLKIKNQKISDPNLLAGFISAEGCFYILITKSNTKIGQRVRLVFGVTQHFRDENLMKSFINYFGFVNYFVRANHDFGEFKVTKF